MVAIQSGTQAAIMAPTEVLAEQHARKIRELCEPVGVNVELLTSAVPQARRELRLIVEELLDHAWPIDRHPKRLQEGRIILPRRRLAGLWVRILLVERHLLVGQLRATLDGHRPDV